MIGRGRSGSEKKKRRNPPLHFTLYTFHVPPRRGMFQVPNLSAQGLWLLLFQSLTPVPLGVRQPSWLCSLHAVMVTRTNENEQGLSTRRIDPSTFRD